MENFFANLVSINLMNKIRNIVDRKFTFLINKWREMKDKLFII